MKRGLARFPNRLSGKTPGGTGRRPLVGLDRLDGQSAVEILTFPTEPGAGYLARLAHFGRFGDLCVKLIAAVFDFDNR